MSDEVKINDQELEEVSGGRSGWDCANGSFVNYGNYIVYTVAKGDVLSGIAPRFNDPRRPEAHHLRPRDPLSSSPQEPHPQAAVSFTAPAGAPRADLKLLKEKNNE